jgi:hypothetical protein
MKVSSLGIAVLGVLMLSGILVSSVVAATWPSLPATPVNMMVVYGTDSYFVTRLSNVPAGYDVASGVYRGWCVDRSVTMTKSVTHSVMLYSSLSTTLPAPISGLNWNAINYILNHKQGSMMQIQEAIWHFTNNFSPAGSHTAAWAMINGADANPGYIPGAGNVVAVICLPIPGRYSAQNSIIELRRPGLPGLSPGYWKHNVNVYNGGRGSFSGDPHITRAQLEEYEAIIAAVHPGFTLEWAQQQFQDNQYKGQWLTIANWFNAAAGRLPYTDS